MIKFEWDEKKNSKNDRKHGLKFEEAIYVWSDPQAVEFLDTLHSVNEERFIKIGLNASLGLMVVVFCEKSDTLIRIISARKANLNERNIYERPLRLL